VSFHTITHPDGAVYACFCAAGENHRATHTTPDEWAAGLRPASIRKEQSEESR
jgi:hypothetical protein